MNSSTQPSLRARMRAHRILLSAVTGVVLVFAIGVPMAVSYDARVDRQRLGYEDAADMARLQDDLIADEGRVQELQVRPGETVSVGDAQFTPRDGNSVVVTGSVEGFCVRTSNAEPDIRGWTYDSLEGASAYDDVPGGACGP